ncbi:MAG: hemerythrin domain-containing protein [Jatrophihabitantaceae bacterium]
MTDSTRQSLVSVLSSDHAAIAGLIEHGLRELGAEDSRPAREQIVMELVRHFVAEEQYLHPAIRERVDGGEQLADAAAQSDRECEQLLRDLENSDSTDAELHEVLARLRARFQTHVRTQEREVFPALAAAFSPPELDELGADVLGAEQLAPTRPRAHLFDSAATSKGVSLVEGFVDRVRDAYSRRGVAPDEDGSD